MKKEDFVKDFYVRKNNEDERFSTKHGAVEFEITRKYIEKYLKDGDRILEIGCGTGRYSLYYARMGYEIDAIELVQENLDVLNKNKLPSDNVNAVQGNATDLSIYKSETFDITLLLGPMYHMFTKEDKLKCLHEAIRVTKKYGTIFVAYCQFDASIIQACFMGEMYDFVVENGLLDESKFLPISNPLGVFELYRKEDVDSLIVNTNVERLHYVGTDMYTHYYSERIASFDEIMYQKYIEYTLSICENQNLVGISNHTLDILKKL